MYQKQLSQGRMESYLNSLENFGFLNVETALAVRVSSMVVSAVRTAAEWTHVPMRAV